jgi:adenosylmethionine-8-amino-7-oxononanoate aminotransferase
MSAHLFARGRELPRAVRARGAEIWDADGKRWLDGSSGAVVVNIGHGVAEVADAVAAQSREVAYVHGSMFTTDAVEAYAEELASVLPVDGARVYPVSGGSEAVETALKMARAYHLARGEDRSVVIGREGSYHGNTRGALDVSGRESLRRPYLPWLGSARRALPAYEYRCPFPDTHPLGCGARHAEALEELIVAEGPARVAAFVAEPIAGAALGACLPPEDYWPLVAEVCRRHGVLLVADEVMTGFGRTGRWFASEHWGLRPDILTAGKGAASGYWPLGLAACSGEIHDTIASTGFTHGFTYSHHAAGAAAGSAVMRVMRERGLVEASARQGRRLSGALAAELGGHPAVGDIRGRGLLVGIELVEDRASRAPVPRSARLTERVVAQARDVGLLVYPSTGCADGTDGDVVLLGPPLVVSDAEVDEIAALTATAVRRASAEVRGAGGGCLRTAPEPVRS